MKYSYTNIDSLEAHRVDNISDYDLQISMMKHALNNGFNLDFSGKRLLKATIRARLEALRDARSRIDALINDVDDINLD